ncbi:hypothetical protein BJ165DRAFT_1349706 [Panaeolus papilionaceus]|nr:hypothetical protein BJ165DRAFT_1349706 [Panaeolus papilionaceus]
MVPRTPIPDPQCVGHTELPNAHDDRVRLLSQEDLEFAQTPLFKQLAQGLALTTGSALGSAPPSVEECLKAYLVPNRVGMSAGARAWAKHAHRSMPPTGWWGNPKGPLAVVNARALEVFFRIVEGATWRNLHWLPHEVLVYEVRVVEGYGMRWAREMGGEMVGSGGGDVDSKPWMFRGFVEPMMENGHEVGWRHPLNLEKPAVVESQVSEGLESR